MTPRQRRSRSQRSALAPASSDRRGQPGASRLVAGRDPSGVGAGLCGDARHARAGARRAARDALDRRQRDRLGDERGLASLGGAPARDRVVLGEVQPHVGTAEGRQSLDARTDVSENSAIVSATAARASRAEAVAKYTRWANSASSWSRTSRSVHWASACQQATVSRPAERLSAIVSAKPRLITSGASSTLRATATLRSAGTRSCWRASAASSIPTSSCISTEVFPAPIAPSAPLTTSTSSPAITRSKSTPQRVIEEHALDRLRVEQPRELVDGSVELGGRRAAGVRQLRGQLGGEELRDLLELRQRAYAALPPCLRYAYPSSPDRQQTRGVPQRAVAVVGQHRDDRVAQVTVRGSADVGVGEQVLQAPRRHSRRSRPAARRPRAD